MSQSRMEGEQGIKVQDLEQTTIADQKNRVLNAIREGIRAYESLGTRDIRNGEVLEDLKKNIEKFKVTINGTELCFAKYRNQKLEFPEIDLPYFLLEQILNALFEKVNDGVFNDSSKALCLYNALKEVTNITRQNGLVGNKHTYRCGALPKLPIVGDEVQIERKPKNKSNSHLYSGTNFSLSNSSHSSSSSGSSPTQSLFSPPKFIYAGIENADDCKIQLENAKRCVLDAIITANDLYHDEWKKRIQAVMKAAFLSRQPQGSPLLAQDQLFEFKNFNALTIDNIEQLLENLLKTLKGNSNTLLVYLTDLTVNKDRKRVLVHHHQQGKYLFDLPKTIRHLESPTAASEKATYEEQQRDIKKMAEETRNLALATIQTLKKKLVKFSENESELDLLCKAEEIALHNHLAYVEKMPDWQIPIEYIKLQESYHSFKLDRARSRRAAKYLKIYLHRKKLQRECHLVTQDACLTQLIADAFDPDARAVINKKIENLTINIEIEQIKNAVHQPKNNALGALLIYAKAAVIVPLSDIPRSAPIPIPAASHFGTLPDSDDAKYAGAMLLERHESMIDQLKQARFSFGQVNKAMTDNDLLILKKMIPLKEFISSDFDREKYIKYRTLFKPFLLLAQTMEGDKISAIEGLLTKTSILNEFVILTREIGQAKKKIRAITQLHDEDSTVTCYAKHKLRIAFYKMMKEKYTELNQSVNTINHALSRLVSDESNLEKNFIKANEVIDEALRQKKVYVSYRQSVSNFFNSLDAIFLKFEHEGLLNIRRSNKRKRMEESQAETETETESETDKEFIRPLKKAKLQHVQFFSGNAGRDKCHEDDLTPEEEDVNYFHVLVNDSKAMNKFLQRAEDTRNQYSSWHENNDIRDWAVLTGAERQLYFENAYIALSDQIDQFKRIINHSVILDAQQEIKLKQLMNGIFAAQEKLAKRSSAFKRFIDNKIPVDNEQQLLDALYLDVKARIIQATQNKHVTCPIALPDTKSPVEQASILNKIHVWSKKECGKVNVRLKGINTFNDCKTWDKLQDWHTRECLQIFDQLTDDRPQQRAKAFNCKIAPSCIPPKVDKSIWGNIGGYFSGAGLTTGGAGMMGLGFLLSPLGGIGIGVMAFGAVLSLLGMAVMGINAALGEKEIVHADFEKVWQRSNLEPKHNNIAIFKKLSRFAAEPPAHSQTRKAAQTRKAVLPLLSQESGEYSFIKGNTHASVQPEYSLSPTRR